MLDLDNPISQVEFARLIGVSKATVTRLVQSGRLKRGDSGVIWLRTYLRALEKAAADAAPKGLTAARMDLAHVQAEHARHRLGQKQALLAPTWILRRAMVGYAEQVSKAVRTLGPRARTILGFTAPMAASVDEFVREFEVLGKDAGPAFDAALMDARRAARRVGNTDLGE